MSRQGKSKEDYTRNNSEVGKLARSLERRGMGFKIYMEPPRWVEGRSILPRTLQSHLGESPKTPSAKPERR